MSKSVYLGGMTDGEGLALEERYINVPRRQQASAHREAPARREAPVRKQAPRRAPQRPAAKGRQSVKGRRSPAVSVALGLYKALVVVSAIIVAAYIGLNLVAKPPAQGEVPQQNPSQGTDTSGGGTVPGDVSEEDPTALVRRKDVYNILLAATDKEGYRTDTMMVMCYDIPNQKVGVVSVPRDTLVARSSGNPHLVYGSGGVEQRVEDISYMLGIPIDGYVKVNIKGFITLVDYLGGVDFYVPCDMDYDDPYQDLYIHYTEGQHHLNGQQAMEVARFRKNNDGSGYSDVGRTQTQQQLLVALAKKVLAWDNITKINGFVEIFNENVDTNLTLQNMLYFASKAIDLDPSTGVETATLEGNGFGLYRGYKYCYELDEESTLETVNRLINPYTRDLTLEDMNLARAEKYHS